ncbi:MAG TPA: ABC transporter ATP-binding protein [Candidatus Acidoferrales bacterium]|nr:ABC transporter ATP-binding protein [Candidatus Acidoferrales bacterium]HEV3480923.1 ABC transporter ATP-binding protein [Candidatus Acidoferrales bacterium]
MKDILLMINWVWNRDRLRCILLSLSLIAWSLLSMSDPLLLKVIFDFATLHHHLPVSAVLFLLATLLTRACCRSWFEAQSTSTHAWLTRLLKLLAFEQFWVPLVTSDTPADNGGITGSYIYEAERAADFMIQLFVSGVSPLLSLIFCIAAISLLDWRLVIGISAVMIVSLIAKYHYTSKGLVLSRECRAAEEQCAQYLADVLPRRETCSLLGCQSREAAIFSDQAVKVMRTRSATGAISAWSECYPACSVACLLTLSVFIYGYRSPIHVGEALTSYYLLARMFEPIDALGFMMRHAIELFPALEKFSMLTQMRYSAVVDVGDNRLRPLDPRPLVVRDAELAIGKRILLKNISLTLGCGDVVGVTGHSGLGKTTFTRSLLRLHKLNRGLAALHGYEIGSLPESLLRRHVVLLSHDPVIFDRSIEDNLRMAKPDATEGEMVSLLRLVELTECRARLQRQTVGCMGSSLSGGERQRLALARGLLLGPDILILDEATAGLDAAREERIVVQLRQSFPLLAILIVSHRKSTIALCDRVLNLEEGQSIQVDPHALILVEETGTEMPIGTVDSEL